MLTYAEMKEKPSRFLSMTGLTVEEFQALLPSFEQSWDAAIAEKQSGQTRKRKAGGGRKAVLRTGEARLLFILVYFKLYPLQETQGVLFGLSQSQANEWIHRLTPILRAALGQDELLPERDPAIMEEVLSEYGLLDFAIDGTERRRQRPLDSTEQKVYYSGKKSPYAEKQCDRSPRNEGCLLSEPDVSRQTP